MGSSHARAWWIKAQFTNPTLNMTVDAGTNTLVGTRSTYTRTYWFVGYNQYYTVTLSLCDRCKQSHWLETSDSDRAVG
ncbi:MAG TPA: hypothetical protein VGR15_08255 [Bacteroidota bacterium]|jgi:hypothetical protein|nr:hypothetical protein [Bacteroidota bacterium]